jgi:hypothetical protein
MGHGHVNSQSTGSLTNTLRLFTNHRPILLAAILIDFSAAAPVKPILPIPFRSRDPVMLSRFHIKIIALEAGPFQALKLSSAIIKRPPSFRKRNPPNPRLPLSPSPLLSMYMIRVSPFSPLIRPSLGVNSLSRTSPLFCAVSLEKNLEGVLIKTSFVNTVQPVKELNCDMFPACGRASHI